jgi:RNA polymerase sigma-70 factor (ECF subfamily)
VADDLLQQVFVRAWQARDAYQEQGRERSYLLKIADRLACDRARRVGIEVTIDDEAWRQREPASGEPSPLDDLVATEAAGELAAALDRISPAQRRVLLLRYFSDMEFAEIARLMNIPLNTALSHARRGLVALRKLTSQKTA